MLNSYLIALLFGILIYVAMIFDSIFIEVTDKPVSPKIPLLVMLILWLFCEYVNVTYLTVKINYDLGTGFFN